MNETAHREQTPQALLPLPGARVHTLQREGGAANFALMGIWMGTLTLVTVFAAALDGRVPEAVLPWVSVPVVLAGFVGAGFAHRRIATGGSAWRLHLTADRRVLERTSPPAAFDLTRSGLRTTRYEYSTRAGRAAMPTVTVDLPDGKALVITGPIGVGWQNLGEEDAGFGTGGPTPDRSRAPDVRLDDAAAFHAVSSLGR